MIRLLKNGLVPSTEVDMLIITLGARKPNDESGSTFLPRTHVGWDPSLTDTEVYEAGRGWWRMAAGAQNERLALIIGGGLVRLAVQISDWAPVTEDGRRAFAGPILNSGDPVHREFVGKPDPSGSNSRNPARYWDAKNVSGQYTACLCGCGAEVRNRWLPGHDQRAIHARIAQDFGGDVANFVEWYDSDDAKRSRRDAG